MRVLICAPTSREYRAMRYALDKAQNLKHTYDLVEVGIGKALSSAGVARALTLAQIGRASCRERVCLSV